MLVDLAGHDDPDRALCARASSGRLAGFSAKVRAERVDGSPLGEGWAIFHRYGKVDDANQVEYTEWDGYVELAADRAVDTGDRGRLWFAAPFRLIPAADEFSFLPSILVTTRHWRGLDDRRVGLLVVEEDDPPQDRSGRWPDYSA